MRTRRIPSRLTSRARVAGALAVCVVLAACDDSPKPTRVAPESPIRHQMTTSQLQTLARRRIFFGHQSVGRNIVDGVREVIASTPGADVRVVRTAEAWAVEGPALMESEIGRNGDPAGKTAAFAAAVARGLDDGAIALHKYCYVDMTVSTDPDSLFAHYRDAMRALRQRHPQVTFVHVTMPLTADDDTRLKRTVKRLLGRTEAMTLNRKRNQFNRLMLAEYAGREPVFDLAGVESLRRDGSRTFFEQGGERVFVLAPEYTDDGGHLNAAGRRVVAERLLAFLAAVPVATTRMAAR